MQRLFIHKTEQGFQVSPIADDGSLGQPQSLQRWAQDVTDLSEVSLVLDARDYVVRWVDMPGVKTRQLSKALPFALEESLIQDIDDYLIFNAGREAQKVRAYVLEKDFLERLLQAFKLENVQVLALIPVTQLLQDKWVIQAFKQGWLISFYGYFEAWVSEQTLPLVLESSLERIRDKKLLIKAQGLDTAQLMRTNIETGFPDAFTQIEVQVSENNSVLAYEADKNLFNFVQNRITEVNKKEHAPIWFKPLIGLLAACFLLWFVNINVQNYQLNKQNKQVREQTEALYKKLFPGERIRFLKRQIKAKLAGGQVESVDFIALVNKTAFIYAKNTGISLKSLRFNERKQVLNLELQAQSLDGLQTFKDALIKAGLNADIASASNDKGTVKGRMSIAFKESV